jgi:hypothetical protein
VIRVRAVNVRVSAVAKKKNSSPASPIDLDLRFKPTDKPIDPNTKRFDIFLIDTGWNQTVGKVIHSHLSVFFGIDNQDSFYILSRDQSVELIKRAPHLIGHDPIMLVYDVRAPANRQSRGYHGFRLNLGLIKRPEQALMRLQEFLRFIALNRTVVRLDRSIQRELHREGLDGMVKILRDASTELL